MYTIMKKQGFILLLFVFGILLSSCGSAAIPSSVVFANEDTSLVFGASYFPDNKCYTDAGIYYQTEHLLKYYDYNIGKSFVLCGKTNCRHSDEKCAAWYDDFRHVKGLAMFEDSLYVVALNKNKQSYDLVQMNVVCEDRKTICSIPIGNYSSGNWIASDIRYVYYSGSMAWVGLQYTYLPKADEEQQSGFRIDAEEAV